MSLILEALKKSEAERQRGKAPGLFVEQAVLPRRTRRRSPAWVFAVGVLLVAVVAWLGWREWSREPLVAAAPAGAAKPSTAAPIPALQTEASSPRAEESVSATATVAPVAVPGPVPIASPPVAAPARKPEASPPPAAVAAPVPSQAPALESPAEPALPRLADLSAAERNGLPPLKITMHVFAEEPAQRFVIIDGRRHGEGATPADGVVIREIQRDGLVLSLNGRDILLPRP